MSAVTITVSRNFESLVDMELVTEEDMREIGLLARERIVRRTRQAQGADGPFQELSLRYAAQKKDALGTDAADLTVSGNMLNHLTIVEVEADGTTGKVSLGWDQ